MKKTRLLSVTLVLMPLLFLVACQDKPASTTNTAAQKDPKRAAIDDAIAKTTPDEKKKIDEFKAMKPEINGQVSAKTLSEIVDDFAKNKGAFNINPIGWQASQKKNNRWKVIFHYQDYNKVYQSAEWEYNPESKKLYPFDMENAKQFWSGEKTGDKSSTAAKGKA